MTKERILWIVWWSLWIAINFAILLVITIYVLKLIPVIFSLLKNWQVLSKKEKIKYIVTFITLILVLWITIYAWWVFLVKMYDLLYHNFIS